MSGLQPDVEMGDHQNAELWKVLFDEDVEMQSSDQASEQRKSSTSVQNSHSISTDHDDSVRQPP